MIARPLLAVRVVGHTRCIIAIGRGEQSFGLSRHFRDDSGKNKPRQGAQGVVVKRRPAGIYQRCAAGAVELIDRIPLKIDDLMHLQACHRNTTP